MAQLLTLEHGSRRRRTIARQYFWKRVLGVLVPIRGQRAERFELGNGLEPSRNLAAVLPPPPIDGERDVRGHQLLQGAQDERGLEVTHQEQHEREEHQVL